VTRTWTRSDLTFASGDGSCAAWLYTPSGVTGDAPGPVLVMAHGLGGLRTERLDAFAERFAAAGYSCLVFDYRTFGASPGEPRDLLDIARQREDWRSAVAVARTLPTVDPDRVVVWGTSFSGGHVLVTAAEDPRIAAAVSQCPFTDGLASALAMDPLTSVRVTALGLAVAIPAVLAYNFLVDVFFLYYVRLVLCRVQVQFKIMCFFLALDFGPYFGRHTCRQLRVKRNAAYAYTLLTSGLLQSMELAAVKQLAENAGYLLFHYTRSVVAYRN